MSTLPRLVVLPYSPWSERARWALEHHDLRYQTVVHAPVLGERRLRRLIGGRTGRVTVPVLLDQDTVLTESWDIARYADRVGSGSKLIPAEREDEIRHWNDLADRTMVAGRALVVAALLRSPGALDESAPPSIPTWARPALRPFARQATRWFARKYELNLEDTSAYERTMREGLDTLRSALSGGSPYLLGSFSYADIVTATALQGVSPVAEVFIRLPPATRQAWTQEHLAHDYADLIQWRDDLYSRHRLSGIHPR
jgi:glutathione S-transferase